MVLPFLSSAGAAAAAAGAAPPAAGAAPTPLEMLEIISFTLTPSKALENRAVMNSKFLKPYHNIERNTAWKLVTFFLLFFKQNWAPVKIILQYTLLGK